MTYDSHEAWKLARDPATPARVLFELAQSNPEVHPALAANPSTYPDLLDWLGRLGDPKIDAILAERAQAASQPGTQQGQSAGSTPSRPITSGTPERTSILSRPTGTVPPQSVTPPAAAPPRGATPPAHAPDAAPSRPVTPPAQVPPVIPPRTATPPTEVPPTIPPRTVTPPAEVSPAAAPRRTEPPTVAVPPQSASPQPARPAYQQSPPRVQFPPMQPSGYPADGNVYLDPAAAAAKSKPRSSRLLFTLTAIGAALVIVGAFFLMQHLGSPKDPPFGSPTGTDSATAPQTETAPESPEPSDPGATSEPTNGEQTPNLPDLQAAQAALNDALQASSCEDVTGAVEAFGTFEQTVTNNTDLVRGDIEDALRNSLGTLQSHCNTRHAVRAGAAMVERGSTYANVFGATDWISPTSPGQADAASIEGFKSRSENIVCEIGGDGALCTIFQYDFAPPAGCTAGEPVTITATTDGAQVDCSRTLIPGDRVLLDYGQASKVGRFTCSSDSMGMHCWDTWSGVGFDVRRAEFNIRTPVFGQ